MLKQLCMNAEDSIESESVRGTTDTYVKLICKDMLKQVRYNVKMRHSN